MPENVVEYQFLPYWDLLLIYYQKENIEKQKNLHNMYVLLSISWWFFIFYSVILCCIQDHGSLYPAIDAALNWILASRFVFVPSAMAASQEMKENSSIGNSLASMGTLLSLFLAGGSTEVLAPSIETLYTGVVLHAFYDKFEVFVGAILFLEIFY